MFHELLDWEKHKWYLEIKVMDKKLPGEKIFKKLSAHLSKKHKGDILAVDPKTGRYLVGKDELVVALEARKLYPGILFSFFRVGYPFVHKFRSFR